MSEKLKIKAMRAGGAPMYYTAELTRAARSGWAIIFDPTPGGRVRQDGKRAYSLRFPVLILSDLLEHPEEAAMALADELEFAHRMGDAA